MTTVDLCAGICSDKIACRFRAGDSARINKIASDDAYHHNKASAIKPPRPPGAGSYVGRENWREKATEISAKIQDGASGAGTGSAQVYGETPEGSFAAG